MGLQAMIAALILEQLMSACLRLTWNQIFAIVDQLSRDDVVQLSHDKPTISRASLPKPTGVTSSCIG